MTDELSLDSAAVQWSVPKADRHTKPVVIVLHGYGADEHDLFGLVPHLPSEFTYAAVRAPLSPPWPLAGASWYPIEGLNARSGESVTRAAEAVLRWATSEGIEQFGLLGFSQGGAVSLQTLRLDAERVRFAVNLSGYVAEGDLETDGAMRDAERPVFWGRGTLDTVIPQHNIAHTAQWLPPMCKLTGGVYSGLGHAISADELGDVVHFLETQLPIS